MTDNQTKEIVKRLEHFLSKETDPKYLKQKLKELFMEVSIMSLTAHETGLDVPHFIRDGMYWLKNVVEILDIDHEYVHGDLTED